MNEKKLFEFDDDFGEIIVVELPKTSEVYGTNINWYYPSCPTGGWYYDT